MMLHIQVITLPNERFPASSLINCLAEIWREQGHKITVGPARRLKADIGILHIDRTRIDEAWLPENPRGIPLLNGSLLDISKRRISRNLLQRDSGYKGPVIIKTNANYFGWPERASSSSQMMLRFYHMLIRKNIPWRWTRLFLPGSYTVIEAMDQLPAWVWRRDDLVVEKFLPEKDGDEFVLRTWLFFGPKEYGVRMFSRHPVVKAGGITRYEYIDDFPDSLRKVRDELKVDFGKFDYVMVNGEAVLLDVNKTPSMTTANPSSGHSPNMLKLASGLECFLEGKK